MIAAAPSATAFFVWAFVAFAELGRAGARGSVEGGGLGAPILSVVCLSSLMIGEAIGGSLFWAAILAGALVGAVAALFVNKRRADVPSPADGARDDE